MNSPPPPRDDVAADLSRAMRELLATMREALRTRLALGIVELEIYLRAMLTILLWAVAAFVCVMLGVAFAVASLVVALWNTHRVLALLTANLVFAVVAVLFGLLCARSLRTAQNGTRVSVLTVRFGVPLWLHLSAPFLRVLVVHSFHGLRGTWTLFHHVPGHGLHHLIPRGRG
jgi:uncharacterized membrane protein YqjE